MTGGTPILLSVVWYYRLIFICHVPCWQNTQAIKRPAPGGAEADRSRDEEDGRAETLQLTRREILSALNQ